MTDAEKIYAWWFPSPCGVNIVGNLEIDRAFEDQKIVSVPLRGKYCRECNNIFSHVAYRLRCFRPLAG